MERVVSNCISTSCILSKNFITVVLVSIDVGDGGHNVDSGFKTPLLLVGGHNQTAAGDLLQSS